MLLRFLISSLVLWIGLGLGAAMPALGNDYYVPPDVVGDLDGTDGDDTFTIEENGTVDGAVNGLGGDDTINNCGDVLNDINGGTGTNSITNSGIVQSEIYSSYNEGDNSSGGSNIITNSGTVNGDIYGSCNEGDNSSGGSPS